MNVQSQKPQFIPFKPILAKWMKDPAFKAEYDALEPEFQIIEATIKKRLEKNWSQKDLAEKIGTKQSAISRLESGNANPSLRFLKKIATALDSKLVIEFR